MAKRKLEIKVTETGAEGTSRKLGGVDKSIANMAKTVITATAALYGLKKGFDFLKGTVVIAGEFQALETRLVSLYGNVDKASAAFSDFKKVAGTTPFSLKGVVEAGAQLKAFGLEAQAQIKPISDLAAFMGLDVVEAANAVGRAFAGGAGAADILRERGILNLIKSFKGIDDLTKLTLPEFRKAMLDTFVAPAAGIVGSTDRLSQTYVGAISNMKDALDVFSAEIGDTLLPTVTDAAKGIGELSGETTRFIRELKTGGQITKDFASEQWKEIIALDKSVSGFQSLSKELANLADKKDKTILDTQRYSLLISKLNNQYGEYLPNIIDESIAYDDLSASLNAAKVALMNFSAERIRILQIADIQEQLALAQNEFDKFNNYLQQYEAGNITPQNMIDPQEWKRQRGEAENELRTLRAIFEKFNDEAIILEPLFTIRIPELDLPEFTLDEFKFNIEDTELLNADDFNDRIQNQIDENINVQMNITPEMRLTEQKGELENHMSTLREWRDLGLDVSDQLSGAYEEYLETIRMLNGTESNEYLAALEIKKMADEEYFEWKKEKYVEDNQTFFDALDMTLDATESAVKTMIDTRLTGSEKMKQIAENLRDQSISFLADLLKEYIKNQIITAGISKASQAAAVATAAVTGTAIAQAYAAAAAATSLATLGGNAAPAIAGMTATAAASKVIFAETGFEGLINKPTMFVVGEKNKPEYVSVTPQNKISNLSSTSTTINNSSKIDNSGIERRLDTLADVIRNNRAMIKVIAKTIDPIDVSELAEEGDMQRNVN